VPCPRTKRPCGPNRPRPGDGLVVRRRSYEPRITSQLHLPNLPTHVMAVSVLHHARGRGWFGFGDFSALARAGKPLQLPAPARVNMVGGLVGFRRSASRQEGESRVEQQGTVKASSQLGRSALASSWLVVRNRSGTGSAHGRGCKERCSGGDRGP
jgi:hypothetical protein